MCFEFIFIYCFDLLRLRYIIKILCLRMNRHSIFFSFLQCAQLKRKYVFKYFNSLLFGWNYFRRLCLRRSIYYLYDLDLFWFFFFLKKDPFKCGSNYDCGQCDSLGGFVCFDGKATCSTGADAARCVPTCVFFFFFKKNGLFFI